MMRILLTQEIPDEVIEHFQRHHEFEFVVAPDPASETIRAIIGEFDATLVRSATKIDRKTIEAGKKLKVIGRAGVGVDNIDIESATQFAIPVCNAPEANSTSVAEHTLAMMMYCFKNLGQLDREARQGNWYIRDHAEASELCGAKLMLFGFGSIARKLANMATNLGMEVGFYDPFVSDDVVPNNLRRWSNLKGMISDCDVLSLHAPLTEETRGLFDKKMLSLCKKDSILINTSRGDLIVESDLLELLELGHFRSVGLDVFCKEPITTVHPFSKFDRILMTPHTAALTSESRSRMASDAMQGIADVLEGRRPRWLCNDVF